MTTKPDLMSLGLLEVNPSAYTARFGGQEVELSATEVEILAALVANSSKVSSRSELAQAVGRQERTVDVLISALRQKIAPEFVRNVRGRGWILNRTLLQV
jgi:two-component system OmpR family response regulator